MTGSWPHREKTPWEGIPLAERSSHAPADIKLILVDMDGVIVDFHTALFDLLGRPDLKGDGWPKGVYDFDGVCGLETKRVWHAVATAGVSFWEELPWTHDGRWLVSLLHHEIGIPWRLCSTPSDHWSSVVGKLVWLQRNIDPRFRNYHFTSRKEDLARPGTLLIDDCEENIKKFIAAGGQGYLVPRPWNHGQGGMMTPNAGIYDVLDPVLPIGGLE